MGGGLFKVRLASSDKPGGKSGGFRIITYVVIKNEDGDHHICLVTIYDKGEESTIKTKDLKALVLHLKEAGILRE